MSAVIDTTSAKPSAWLLPADAAGAPAVEYVIAYRLTDKRSRLALTCHTSSTLTPGQGTHG
jgi:hypothetical protein